MKRLIIALMLLIAVPAIAQDAGITVGEVPCFERAIASVFSELGARYEYGELTLMDTIVYLVEINTRCQELSVRSDNYDLIGIIGPIDLLSQDTLNLAWLTPYSQTYTVMELTELNDECVEFLLLNVAGPPESATSIFLPECTAFVIIDGGTVWELTLKPQK